MKKETKAKKLREYRQMMKITRPFRGYLGNQYEYWEARWKKLKYNQ